MILPPGAGSAVAGSVPAGAPEAAPAAGFCSPPQAPAASRSVAMITAGNDERIEAPNVGG